MMIILKGETQNDHFWGYMNKRDTIYKSFHSTHIQSF